jgi:hypothetical protein
VRTLIGVVTGTKLDKYDERIAWIWPLVEVKGSTCNEVRDHEQEFPARGYIFWPKAPNVEKGALFHFHAKDHGIRKEGGDEFMVVNPRPVLEVVDLRSFGECEQVRKALDDGIQVLGLPSTKVLVWCKGGLVVGPIQLVVGKGGLAFLEGSNRARIPCFQLSEGDVRQIEYEGVTRLMIARPSLGAPHGYVDWDDDRSVLKRALDYAVTRSTVGVVHRPKEMIEAALDALTKNGSTADNRLELYRLDRSRAIAALGTQLGAYASDVVTTLRKHPSIVTEIEQLKKTERAEAEKEIHLAMVQQRQQLGQLQEERNAIEEALRAAKKSLEETEELVRAQTLAIEGTIQNRILEVLSNAPALLADVALLKPFLGISQTAETSSEIHVASWKRSTNMISSAKELRAKIIPTLKWLGVPATAYQPIHAAFAGGLLPVVAGSRALEALRAYAHVATGGRSIVVQATSAFADVQDIFGRVVERRFVPQASGLIDVVQAARRSEGLFLVILEGINRGATESYLLPLVKAAVRRNIEISLFHPSAVEPTDLYRSAARFDWPRNLLLAATLIEGPTTLPVAPDLWSDGVLIQTDLEGTSRVATGLGDDPSELEASSNLLGATPSLENSEWIREVAVSTEAVASQFEGGMKTLGADAAAIQNAIMRCILVPFLASIEDEAERNTQIKLAEKIAGNSIEGWIATARRRIS